MDVRVGLLADDAWPAEDDKTSFMSVGVDISELIIFERTTNFFAHGAN